MADHTPDECIDKVWDIANANPDYCEPHFSTLCDQWWLVFIKCAHGEFTGESRGQVDVSAAFLGALSNYWRAHPDSVPVPESEMRG